MNKVHYICITHKQYNQAQQLRIVLVCDFTMSAKLSLIVQIKQTLISHIANHSRWENFAVFMD